MTEELKPQTIDAEMKFLQRWASLAVTGGVVPHGTTLAQTMAIIATGKEFGLQTFQSLRTFFFVNGRLCSSADFLLAQLKKGGVKIKLVESTDKKCVMEFCKADESPITINWTIEMAVRANLANKDNWKKYPEDMLVARCKSRAAHFYPDITLGLYSIEEMEGIESVPAEIISSPEPKTKEQLDKEIDTFINNQPALPEPVEQETAPEQIETKEPEKVEPKKGKKTKPVKAKAEPDPESPKEITFDGEVKPVPKVQGEPGINKGYIDLLKKKEKELPLFSKYYRSVLHRYFDGLYDYPGMSMGQAQQLLKWLVGLSNGELDCKLIDTELRIFEPPVSPEERI